MAPWTPADWLRSFEAVGGSYTLDADGGRLHVVTSFVGTTREERDEARRLIVELESDPDRVVAICDHIEHRRLPAT